MQSGVPVRKRCITVHASEIWHRRVCPRPNGFAEYRENLPNAGMPYGVTGLDDQEYQVLSERYRYSGLIKLLISYHKLDDRSTTDLTLLDALDSKLRIVEKIWRGIMI